MDQINKNIHQHQLKYKGGVGYYLNAKELRKLKKEISPDIINVHYASGYGTLARKSKLCPILLSVWGSDVYDFPNKSFVNKTAHQYACREKVRRMHRSFLETYRKISPA